jgi:hypothetical protein
VPPATEELEQRKAALALAEAELSRRLWAKHLKGEVPVLRGVVAVGENPDEVETRLRAQAGLRKNDMAFVILRVIEAPSPGLLQAQRESEVAAQKITADRFAAEDEWRPPRRATIPDQLTPVQVSVVIDDSCWSPDCWRRLCASVDGWRAPRPHCALAADQIRPRTRQGRAGTQLSAAPRGLKARRRAAR